MAHTSVESGARLVVHDHGSEGRHHRLGESQPRWCRSRRASMAREGEGALMAVVGMLAASRGDGHRRIRGESPGSGHRRAAADG
ncbi:keratin, type II cytoskeletal 2 epidermal-like [Iris pallida]|uniref:Keratin, type II cytoskeletal 2 epidermal-like n=1 Tax=Iris pallida TaxID=29817 RepID=A0AAX6EPX1_IRIPA|nr:keratin, type II cytoskeletal 2 epidermal-like [Iris pallida]KAJ6830562.1 keratin, type II cytoskeletal 2 epidermal-like [Iris pallida]